MRRTGSVGLRVTASATGTRGSLRVRRTVGQAGGQRIAGHIGVLPCRRGHGAQRAPRLADRLVHLGHPVGKIAVVKRPAVNRRQRVRRQRRVRVPAPAGTGGRTTSRSGARPVSPNSRRFERCVISTAMPAAQKPSSNSVAFFTDMPRPAANEVAERSGAAARISTAAAARVAAVGDGAAGGAPGTLHRDQQSERVGRLVGQCVEGNRCGRTTYEICVRGGKLPADPDGMAPMPSRS